MRVCAAGPSAGAGHPEPWLEPSRDGSLLRPLKAFWKGSAGVLKKNSELNVLQEAKAEVLCIGHLQKARNQDYFVLPQQLAAASPITSQKHHKRLHCQSQLHSLGAMWERSARVRGNK